MLRRRGKGLEAELVETAERGRGAKRGEGETPATLDAVRRAVGECEALELE